VDIDQLKQSLDRIGWQAQVEAQISERPGFGSPPDLSIVEAQLRTLAPCVDEALLDALEREPGYLVWSLRLAHVTEPARAAQRARRHLDSANWTVRQWACRIADGAAS
jgi:hypothetical protein